MNEAGGIDPDVAEAAALAHDLGHSPFGHIVEEVLDELAVENKVLEGFNGNAQSFRIVTKLAVRHEQIEGLNLTRATLDAILKYPWFRQTGGGGKAKWGAYRSEEQEFQWARARHQSGDERKSVEAEIMDWADDIAYAIHDVEDFYRAGVIPLDRLVSDSAETDRFLNRAIDRLHNVSDYAPDDLKDAFLDLVQALPLRTPYDGSRRQRAVLRSFTATLIGRYIGSLQLNDVPSDDRRIKLDPVSEKQVLMLKQLTWHYVIDSPGLATQQFGQRHIIRKLFEIYLEEAVSGKARERAQYKIFPLRVQEQLRRANGDEEIVRIIVDLIASMTEQQAVQLHQTLTGTTLGSFVDNV